MSTETNADEWRALLSGGCRQYADVDAHPGICVNCGNNPERCPTGVPARGGSVTVEPTGLYECKEGRHWNCHGWMRQSTPTTPRLLICDCFCGHAAAVTMLRNSTLHAPPGWDAGAFANHLEKAVGTALPTDEPNAERGG